MMKKRLWYVDIAVGWPWKNDFLFFILLKNFISNHIFIYHWVMIFIEDNIALQAFLKSFCGQNDPRLWPSVTICIEKDFELNWFDKTPVKWNIILWINHKFLMKILWCELCMIYFFFRKFIDKSIWSINLCRLRLGYQTG